MPATSKTDRIAIENAALVLKAIADRAHDNPDFARHIMALPVPGGAPMVHFVNALGHVAGRHPTDWALARRRDYEEAA